MPRDYHYGYCYLFSAICPESGISAGHVCDKAKTDEVNRHLVDIAAAVPQGRHALVVLDGAGWHRLKSLEIPDNDSLLRLPPYSPELNPVETVFQFLKQGNFANRVFATAEMKDRVEKVWNDFARTPGRVASPAKRSWARLFSTPTAHPASTPRRVCGYFPVLVSLRAHVARRETGPSNLTARLQEICKEQTATILLRGQGRRSA